MRRYFFVLIAAVALVLSACGSSHTSATTTPSRATPATAVAAAQGPTIAGSSYTYNAPQGWYQSTDTGAYKVDSLALAPQKINGFTNNLNVASDATATSSTTLSQYRTGALASLKAVGATNIQVDPQVTIGGKAAIHLSSTLPHGATAYLIESFATQDNGVWWIATFTFAPSVTNEQRSQITQSVLETWKWTD